MSTKIVQPYLFFSGRCEEALEFYRTALGAEVDLIMRYDESPEPAPPGRLPPGFETKVMHATFRVGGSTLMASDGCEADLNFSGFSLSITAATEAEARSALTPWPTGARSSCPWARPSGPPVSAW